MSTGKCVTAAEVVTPRCLDPKDPAFRAIHAAEQFLNAAHPLTPARVAEVEGLLGELAAGRWEDAGPSSREAAWIVWLRLSLLMHPLSRKGA